MSRLSVSLVPNLRAAAITPKDRACISAALDSLTPDCSTNVARVAASRLSAGKAVYVGVARPSTWPISDSPPLTECTSRTGNSHHNIKEVESSTPALHGFLNQRRRPSTTHIFSGSASCVPSCNRLRSTTCKFQPCQYGIYPLNSI